MRGKKVSATILMAFMMTAGIFVFLVPEIGADGTQHYIMGYVDPNSTTGVGAFNATQNGFIYFYIQNRTNEGNVIDAIVDDDPSDLYDPFISLQEGGETGFINDWQVGDPGIMIIERQNGSYITGNRTAYIAFINGTLSNNPFDIFDTVELQKIAAPTMVENGTTYINITWDALWDPNVLIAGYTVYRSTTNDSDLDWQLVGGSVNSPLTDMYYNDTGVVGDTPYYYAIKVVFIGYQNDIPANVDNYENQYWGEGSVPMEAPASALGVDYINITYSPGGAVVDTITIDIGQTTPQVYASGYNNTGPTYTGPVEVDWTWLPVALGYCNPTTSTFTEFTAYFQGGSVNVTGTNASLQDNFTVKINQPTVDYILLTKTPDGVEWDNTTWNMVNPILIYASGYNNTGNTYVGPVDVQWTAAPNPAGDGTFDNNTGTSTTFTGTIEGIVEIKGEYILLGINDTFQKNLFSIPTGIDSVVITDAPDGNPLGPVDLSVGGQILAYASGYNSTGGNYLGLVEVNWTESGALGSFDNLTGTSTIFTAGMIGGLTIIMGENETMNINDTFNINILDPEIDYIQIRDAAGGLGNIVTTGTYSMADMDEFYAAAYNHTADYLYDVSVIWSSDFPSVGDVDTPGIWTNFTAQQVAMNSTCTVTAQYSIPISNTTGLLTVLAPTVDYITITDGPDGAEITTVTLDVTENTTMYASGYNNTGSTYLRLVEVEWDDNPNLGTFDNNTGTNSIFTAGLLSGIATIEGRNDSMDPVVLDDFTLEINPPTIDYILIVDTPDTGTDEIGPLTVDVGFTIMGYAAAFNNTIGGYIGDISAFSWSVTNASGAVATTGPGSGDSSTFDAQSQGGTATWTADDGQGHTDTVSITINPPVIDYIQIRDASSGQGNEVTTDTFTIGDDAKSYFCAGYNNSGGYVSEQQASWTVDSPIGNVNIATGTFTLFEATTTGVGNVNASYLDLLATVEITVNLAPDTTAPLPPTGLLVTQVTAGGSLQLNWNHNTESDRAGYNIYRSTTNGSGFTMINTALVTDSSYLDTGRTNGVTYYYRITCLDDATVPNESDYSGIVDNTADLDTDTDNIFNLVDTDDDGDGLLDTVEDANGNGIKDADETDPLLWDTDHDDYSDSVDAYPLDPTKWEVAPPKEDEEEFPVLLILLPIIIIIIVLILIFALLAKKKPAEELPKEVPPAAEEEIPPAEEELPPEEEVPPPEEEAPPTEEELPPEEEVPPPEEEAPPTEEELPPEEEVPPPEEEGAPERETPPPPPDEGLPPPP